MSFALKISHLRLEPVDFFLDVRTALHLRFFGFPHFIQVVVFALQPGQLVFNQMQALL